MQAIVPRVIAASRTCIAVVGRSSGTLLAVIQVRPKLLRGSMSSPIVWQSRMVHYVGHCSDGIMVVSTVLPCLGRLLGCEAKAGGMETLSKVYFWLQVIGVGDLSVVVNVSR